MNTAHQSGINYLLILGGLVAIGLVIWLLGKLFPGKSNSAAGNALMSAEVIFLPSRNHVIEAKQNEDVEDEGQGEPQTPHEPRSN